jgi:hypothetical protein
MSYKVSEKISKAKGRVADGDATVTFPHRYIYENKVKSRTNDKGEEIIEEILDKDGNPIPTGDWAPESAVEAFSHYMDLFPSEEKAKSDMLFLINRRFYFDDQPGADPIDRAARKLAKDLGIPVAEIAALLAGLKKKEEVSK